MNKSLEEFTVNSIKEYSRNKDDDSLSGFLCLIDLPTTPAVAEACALAIEAGGLSEQVTVSLQVIVRESTL
jgi:hypothetical protein